MQDDGGMQVRQIYALLVEPALHELAAGLVAGRIAEGGQAHAIDPLPRILVGDKPRPIKREAQDGVGRLVTDAVYCQQFAP